MESSGDGEAERSPGDHEHGECVFGCGNERLPVGPSCRTIMDDSECERVQDEYGVASDNEYDRMSGRCWVMIPVEPGDQDVQVDEGHDVTRLHVQRDFLQERGQYGPQVERERGEHAVAAASQHAQSGVKERHQYQEERVTGRIPPQSSG